MNTKDALKLHIAEEILEEEMVIDDEENLLADGMVDSLGMLRLVSFIEETCQITVPPEDFIIENFRTINAIEAYINRQTNLQSGQSESK